MARRASREWVGASLRTSLRVYFGVCPLSLVEAGISRKDVIFHVADADLGWVQIVGCFQVMENGHTAVHHVECSCVAHEDGVVEGGVRLEEGG